MISWRKQLSSFSVACDKWIISIKCCLYDFGNMCEFDHYILFTWLTEHSNIFTFFNIVQLGVFEYEGSFEYSYPERSIKEHFLVYFFSCTERVQSSSIKDQGCIFISNNLSNYSKTPQFACIYLNSYGFSFFETPWKNFESPWNLLEFSLNFILPIL